MDTFGKRLKHLIKSSKYKTLKDFAKEVGMSEVSISRIATGRHNPSYELIEACVNIFSDEEVIWLLTGKDYTSQLKLENKHLQETSEYYKTQYEKTKSDLENLVKLSGNRSKETLSNQLSLFV